MRVLICGGPKTEGVVDTIRPRFQQGGVDFVAEQTLKTIGALFNRGDYFDRAVILAQCIEHEVEDMNDELSIRMLVSDFIENVSNKVTKDTTFVFVANSETLAQIFLEETIEIAPQRKVLLRSGSYTAKFFIETVITPLDSFNAEYVFDESKIESNTTLEENDIIYSVAHGPETGATGEVVSGIREIAFDPKAVVKVETPVEEEPQMPNFDVVDDFDADLGDDINTLSAMTDFDDFESELDSTEGEVYQEGTNTEGFEPIAYNPDNVGGRPTYQSTPEHQPDDQDIQSDDDTQQLSGASEYAISNDYSMEGGTSFDGASFGGINFDKVPMESGSTSSILDKQPQSNIPTFDNPDEFGLHNIPAMEGLEDATQPSPGINPLLGMDPLAALFEDPVVPEDLDKPTPGIEELDIPSPYTMEGEQSGFEGVGDYELPEGMGMEGADGIGDFDSTFGVGTEAIYDEQSNMFDHELFGETQQKPDMTGGMADQFSDDIYNQTEEPEGSVEEEIIQPVGGQAQQGRKGLLGKKQQKQAQQKQGKASKKGQKKGQQAGQTLTAEGVDSKLISILNAYRSRGCSIVITGTPNSGKSTISFNLANLLASLNYSVLLVDMDTVNRTQAYLSKDAYGSVHSLDPENASLKQALNAVNHGVGKYVNVVKPRLHLLTLGLASDIIRGESLAPKQKLARFSSNVRNNYNFIIYDMPFDSATEYAADITFTADQIILTCDATNHGIMNLMLSMSNIDSEDMQEAMFGRSRICFTKYKNFNNVLGNSARSAKDVLMRLDMEVQGLLGIDPEYYFSGIDTCGILPYDDSYEDFWFSETQMSDTPAGRQVFVQLLSNILIRK